MVFFLPLVVRSPENGLQRVGGLAVGFSLDVVVDVLDVLGVVPLDPFDFEPGVAYGTACRISPVSTMVTSGNSPDAPVERADRRFLSWSVRGACNRPRNKGMVVGVFCVGVSGLGDDFDCIISANSYKIGVACGKVSELLGVHR